MNDAWWVLFGLFAWFTSIALLAGALALCDRPAPKPPYTHRSNVRVIEDA